MRLCFIADARSPIARNWITYFIERGDTVTIISSYPCSPSSYPGTQLFQVPLAFSGLSRVGHAGTIGVTRTHSVLSPLLASLRSGGGSMWARDIRNWLAPIEVQRHVPVVKRLIANCSPDLVHAMRIPFEGIVAAKAVPPQIPLALSIWGNDFTLHASRNVLMTRETLRTLQKVTALHCDCQRDLVLAKNWGYSEKKIATVLPGAGGIQRNAFYPGEVNHALYDQLNIPRDSVIVINPRGFRDYVRNDSFFIAIPQILDSFPKTIFLCIGMKANPVAEKWIRQLNIGNNVRLLGHMSRAEMADLFRISQITVSPSIHDGTPNTLLEAMACGCFPVAGDIESIREWIRDGYNGLLCNPLEPSTIASAIVRALGTPGLRISANKINQQLIDERAEYQQVMLHVGEFYSRILDQSITSERQ